MRLLHARTIRLESFEESETPRYAILSHTWGAEEVSFQQIHQPIAPKLSGYAKIEKACRQAERDGLQYIWIDTCCIDKTSSAELSEAINSMFRWYKDAVVCYAYLADVPSDTDIHSMGSAFERSRWWRRGWTLQELLAPLSVLFYGESWQSPLGSKISLSAKIAHITDIPEAVLSGERDISTNSVARRMSWASSRETSRREDTAYCLLGIFGVNMPLLYGEGNKAFIRLQEEIMKDSDDQTLFVWTFHRESLDPNHLHGPFAPHPAAFLLVKNAVPDEMRELDKPYAVTNSGLQISIPIIYVGRFKSHIAILACRPDSELQYLFGIRVRFHSSSTFSRDGTSLPVRIRRDELSGPIKTYYFLRNKGVNSLIPAGSEFCDAYLLRKLPISNSGLRIWSVDPSDAFDAKKGIICFNHSQRIDIHLWDNLKEGFVIRIRANTNFRPCTIYRDSASRPFREDREEHFDKLVVSVGQPRRIEGEGIVCLLDIELPKT